MFQKLTSRLNQAHGVPLTRHRLGFRSYLLILLFVISLTILWIGKPEIVTRGEGREALVARSLFEQGEWILPRGYGGVVPSKPPALHWLIGSAASFFGEINEFACRLPSALASLMFVLLFAGWIAQRDPRRVWPTVIVLVTSFEWFRASVSCRVDMLHASALAAAVILGSGIYSPISSTRMRWFAVVALSVVSTLTKGPVGALLPAAILFIFGYWEHRRPLINMISAGSIALGAINISAIWYLAAYLQGGDAFVEKVSYENLQRFMSTMEDAPHRHSVWYLLGMGIVGFMPWSLPFVLQFARFLFKSPSSSKTFIVPRSLSSSGEETSVEDITEGSVSAEASAHSRAHSSAESSAEDKAGKRRTDNSAGFFNEQKLGWSRGLASWLAYMRRMVLDRWNYLIAEPETRLSLVAILVLFTFYAIPSGKRGVYLLAAYPFGSVIIGRALLESHQVRDRVLAWMTKFFRLVIGLFSAALVLSIICLSSFLLIVPTLPTNIKGAVASLPLAQVDGFISRLPIAELTFFLIANIGDLALLALIIAAIFFGYKLYRTVCQHDLDPFKYSDLSQPRASQPRAIFCASAFGYCCLLMIIQAVVFPLATNSLRISSISNHFDQIRSHLSSSMQINSDQIHRGQIQRDQIQRGQIHRGQEQQQIIYSYGSELYSMAFYSSYKYKSVTPLVDSPDFRGFQDGTFIAMERRYLKRFEGLLLKHSSRINQSVRGVEQEVSVADGCFKIEESYDSSRIEFAGEGSMILVKISCNGAKAQST